MGNTVICMAYVNRLEQLKRTLSAYCSFGHKYSVVIANDGADPLRRADLPDMGGNGIIEILDTEGIKDKTWHDPSVPMNKAFSYAIDEMGADTLILTNPECMPVGDIIGDVETLGHDEYRVYGCLSLDETITHNIGHIDLTALADSVTRGATKDFELAWYQHSRYRPVGYEFCAAISANNMRKLNGYDERLAFGIGYSDNYLLHRIRKMGLVVNMLGNPFVAHQYHEKTDNSEQREGLVRTNKLIYQQLEATVTGVKAVRLITKDIL